MRWGLPRDSSVTLIHTTHTTPTEHSYSQSPDIHSSISPPHHMRRQPHVLTWACHSVAVARLELATACAAKRRALEIGPRGALEAQVQGFSTPAIKSIHASSVRLRQPGGWQAGSYLTAVRVEDAWLPALASVPGDAPDSLGHSRLGLVELLVMARPLADPSCGIDRHGGDAERRPCGIVTCLPEVALRYLFAAPGTSVHLIHLERVAPFVERLSEPLWLRPRLHEIAVQAAGAARSWEAGGATCHAESIEWLLHGSSLTCDAEVDASAVARVRVQPGGEEATSHMNGDPLCGGGTWRSPSRPFGGREQHEI
jgi:hypothetical protein